MKNHRFFVLVMVGDVEEQQNVNHGGCASVVGIIGVDIVAVPVVH